MVDAGEASILERIAAGDPLAVNQCMDAFGGLVWSLARRFSESAADAEDATQEIYLEIWKHSGRYDRSKGSAAVFIGTIARRRLIDRLRSRKRRPQTEEFIEADFPDVDTQSPVPTAMTSEVDAAKAALARLAPDQRQVVLLGVVEGMTHSEIATHTGRPLGTVKTQMRRGMQKIRKLLEAAEVVPDV